MDINEIFKKWVEFTEVNPEEKKFVVTVNNADIFNYNKKIEEALSAGHSLLAALVLKNCFNEYISETAYYSVYDIIHKTESYTKKMKQAEELSTLLENKEVIDYEENLFNEINTIADFYSIRQKTDSLNNKQKLDVFIKAKSAVRHMETLQFKKGKTSETKPIYANPIRAFHDINELLVYTAQDNIDGITLNCIVDNDNLAYSYFCFVIKNGDNIWMTSDRPNENVSRKFCSRSSGRRMDERMKSYLYPYELMGLELSKHNVSMKKATLPKDSSHIPVIGTINDCNTESALWVCLVLTLLADKFFSTETPDCKEAYSGGMVYTEDTDNNTSIVPAGKYGISLAENYKILNMGRITKKDVEENQISYAKSQVRHGFNDWLIDKYGEKVNEDYLNLTGKNEGKEKYLGSEISVIRFDTNIVGAEEEIRNTRMFMARKNMAEMLSAAYEEDVKAQIDGLTKWYYNKLCGRKEWLKTILKDKKIILPKRKYSRLTEEGLIKFNNGEKVSYDMEIPFSVSFDLIRNENCLEIIENTDNSSYSGRLVLGSYDTNRHYRSFWNEGPISYKYEIKVNCPEAMAALLGIELKELPELLQHYTPTKYVGEGNPILNDLDPVEHIPNWISMFYADVCIVVSKSEIAKYGK